MPKIKKVVSSVLLAASLLLPCARVYAEVPDELPGNMVAQRSSDSAEGLSNAIIKKEVELMRMTTLFRMNNPRETSLHRWYEATMSTLAYSVVTAGNITTFSNAFKFHRRPQDFSVGRAETGPFMIFLAECLFFARTAGASLLDLSHAAKEHHKGFDRATFEKRADELQGEIHSLLAQRRQVTGGGDGEQAALQDIANGASAEFVNNYARATRLKTYRLLRGLMTNYTAGTGAFWGGLLEYLAAVQSNPRLAGPSGLGFCASGGGFILSDAISYFGGKHAEKVSKAKLMAKEPSAATSAEQLEQDARGLRSSGGSSPARLHAYELLHKCLTEERAMSEQENKEMWHRYLHDQIINASEGAANIAAGAVLAKAGYNFNKPLNPLAQLHKGDTFLERFGWSALIFTPTGAAGIIDTPAEALYGVHRQHQDVKEGLAPEVVLNDRLHMFDEIDKSI